MSGNKASINFNPPPSPPSLQDLKETLLVDNITGGKDILSSDGDVFKALNGGGELNLRAGSDGIFQLLNSPSYSKAWFYGDDFSAQMGFASGYFIRIKDDILELAGKGDAALNLSATYCGIVKETAISIVTCMHIVRTGTTPILLNAVSEQGISLNSGATGEESSFANNVNQAIILAGKGIRAKTHYTPYLNQLAYQESGSLFEILVKPPTGLVSDFVQTWQPKSGIVAHLADIAAATTWRPNSIPLGGLLTSGATFFINGGAGVYLSFDGSSDDTMFFNDTLNKSGKLYDGSDLALKFYGRLQTDGSGGDTVGWVVLYAFTKDGDNTNTMFTAIPQQDVNVSGELQDIEFDITLGTMTGVMGADQILITVFRNATGTGADSYPNNYELTSLEFEIVP